ncbi:MAG: hypothetical protein FWD39_04080 [Clostridiales bacterium]|nr:hypothetical protein [Clostridiales bacterium]
MGKKLTALILLVVFSLLFASCKENEPNLPSNPSDNSVIKINVISYPEAEACTKEYTSPEKIAAVTDYLSGLSLQNESVENQGPPPGLVYQITIGYEDGTEKIYYHSANMFLGEWKDDTIIWYRMLYDEAAEFDNILYLNTSDK